VTKGGDFSASARSEAKSTTSPRAPNAGLFTVTKVNPSGEKAGLDCLNVLNSIRTSASSTRQQLPLSSHPARIENRVRRKRCVNTPNKRPLNGQKNIPNPLQRIESLELIRNITSGPNSLETHLRRAIQQKN
jgi:hypothetical protein